ncbi:MAG: TonB-dependent receptor, partial [bacterium]|nr:TonB-dependent receptor [bacterium]
NAAQNINNNRLGGTLDQTLGDQDRLSLRYNFVWQRVEAFQLVAGQAPDTTTRNHQARLTWSRGWTPSTTTDFSIGFDRVGSLLTPDERAFGPWIRIGQELAALGPPGRFPVDRATNTFRYAGRLRQVRRNHQLTVGFDLNRRHINGSEVQQHRGLFMFRSAFGRDAVTNLLHGTPASYTVAVGDVHRGFRNWFSQVYVGDDWKATGNLTLSMGLRWEPLTRPTEVNNLTQVPYSSDLNNLAPRLGLAYRLPGRWGALRASYGLHYGEIFTATFIQSRLNPPQNFTISVAAPDLADPLKGLDVSDLDPNTRSTLYSLAP